jgi:hypothetical protein
LPDARLIPLPLSSARKYAEISTCGSMYMAKLEYTFKNDTLFKMLFVRYPGLLKRSSVARY